MWMLDSFYLRSNSGAPPLRVGLLLDSLRLQGCFAEIVRHIQSSNFARVELVVLNSEASNGAKATTAPRSFSTKLMELLRDERRRKTLLFEVYQRWDRGNVDPATDPHAAVDCSEHLHGVEKLVVAPIRKRFVHRFPPEAIERIRASKLDVLIRFGFNILRGEVLNCAKYGVWSYHHGDGDFYRGGPAHFWEVYESNPLSGAMLQVLNEELDAGKVLCKGVFATSPGLSRARNLVTPYWGTNTFAIQKLRELHQYGWEFVERRASASGAYQGRKKIYTAPNNLEMVRWIAPTLVRKSMRRVLQAQKISHWQLAFRRGATSLVEGNAEPDMNGFQWIPTPHGHFYADPFLIEEHGTVWLYFEDFDYASRRAKIACAAMNDRGIEKPIPVLEPSYHLSYPCLLRDGNELFMIPESGANGTVELYRCTRFPDQWRLQKVLFKSAARPLDTTVFKHDGIYWFFVTLRERRGSGTQLWLFYSTAIDGEWQPHRANPISTDVRNSRSAGQVICERGRLYRPSQDCSRCYGNSFTLNEVLMLTQDEYEERAHRRVGPTWARDLIGTHTYARVGDVEVIDGCVQVRAKSVGAAGV